MEFSQRRGWTSISYGNFQGDKCQIATDVSNSPNAFIFWVQRLLRPEATYMKDLWNAENDVKWHSVTVHRTLVFKNKSVERIVPVLIKVINYHSKCVKGLEQGIVCADGSLSWYSEILNRCCGYVLLLNSLIHTACWITKTKFFEENKLMKVYYYSSSAPMGLDLWPLV